MHRYKDSPRVAQLLAEISRLVQTQVELAARLEADSHGNLVEWLRAYDANQAFIHSLREELETWRLPS